MAKNQNIKIYKTEYMGRKAYAIRHIPSTWTAYFNLDIELRNQIKTELESVTLSFEISKQRFRFEYDDPPGRTSLEDYIYTFFDGEHDARVRRIIPPDKSRKRINCFRDNLYCETDCVPDNASRGFQIAEDGKTFTLYLKKSDLTDRMPYSPEFWRFLTKPSNFSFNANTDRIVANWTDAAGIPRKSLLSALCYAFHREGVTEGNFRTKLLEVKAKMEEPGKDDPNNELQIDHLNDDRHNHCMWNLSCVPKIKNQSKTEYFARIKRPYFLYGAVTENGEYRLVFGCNEDVDCAPLHAKPHTWWSYYCCPSIDALIVFLSQLKDLDYRLWGAGKNESIKKLWGDGQRYAPHPAQEFERAQAKSEELLSLPEDAFTKFPEYGILRVYSTIFGVLN